MMAALMGMVLLGRTVVTPSPFEQFEVLRFHEAWWWLLALVWGTLVLLGWRGSLDGILKPMIVGVGLLCATTVGVSWHALAKFDLSSAGFAPRYWLEHCTQENLERFVDAHQGREAHSLLLARVESEANLSLLERLDGLYVLTLAWNSEPVGQNERGQFMFPPVLSDEAVGHISRIKALRALLIWYGSLTEMQRSILRERHPKIELFENLNKL